MSEDEKFDVDDQGFVELGHLERDWYLLQQMRKDKAKLEAGIEKVEAFFKAKMAAAGAEGFKINEVKAVSWKQDATFPAAKYAAANPAVAAAYTIMVPKLDVEALKRDRAEEVKQWTGRRFSFIQTKRNG